MILKLPHNWSWRIGAFELWFWTRLLRVSWTARRSNQSVLKEINPKISLEGLMLRLQYFGHLMQRANSLERPWCWERLKAKEKMTTEDEMVGGHHWLDGHEFEQVPGVDDGQGSLVWDAIAFQNLIYWPSPTTSLVQFLRAIRGADSQAAVLILPQIKLETLMFLLLLVAKLCPTLFWPHGL